MMSKTFTIGMVSLFVVGGLVGIFLMVAEDVEAPGPTYVSGIISSNTTWYLADSPYIVTGNVLVEQGATLTIEAGVVVKFNENNYLQIGGRLLAEGIQNQNISFTSNKTSPAREDWNAIEFTNTSSDSIIQYCEIKYGEYGIYCDGASSMIIENNRIESTKYGIYLKGTSAMIRNNILENNIEGIFGEYSNSQVLNNQFSNNLERAIKFEYSSPQVEGNNITNTRFGINLLQCNGTLIKANIIREGEHAINYDISHSIKIIYNTVVNNTDYGIQDSRSSARIYYNTISENGMGIKVCDMSTPEIRYNNLYGNTNYNAWLHYSTTNDIYAPYNWWGTTDTDLINLSIHDYYDDLSLGKVLYMPFQTSPIVEYGIGLQEGAPWPMFRGNVRHTGLSPYDTSGNDGQLKWSFTANDKVSHTSPAIGSDGTIYIGADDDNLYAINPDGSIKWNFTTGMDIESSPTIGSDGTIYIGSDDSNFYAINSNGTEKWRFMTGSGGLWYSSAAINSEGIIYVGFDDNKLYAINPDGTEIWNFTTGEDVRSSPALSHDGTIYFGSFDNKLYAVNPNGTEKWNFTTNSGIHSSPAIDTDGTIYIGSRDYNLYAINPNGSLKWYYTTGGGIGSSPAIGPDGTIYVGSMDNKMYAINPNGTQKWNFTTGNEVNTSPAIGSEGTIYFGSFDHKIYALYPNGTEKWSFETGWGVRSSPAIGSDGTIYVGSYDYNLYAIGTNGAPPLNQPPNILETVPDQIKPEDSLPWTLDLTVYEADFEDSGSDLNWYLTGIDASLYSVTGMNSSDDVLTFIPIANAYGNDEVVLWLEDSNGSKVTQVLWINITPVNDLPYFDPLPPDFNVHYDDPNSDEDDPTPCEYTFYVHDFETPIENLVLTTSEPTVDSDNGYAEVDGLNVTFHYPQSRVGESIPITLTLSDGTDTAQTVIVVTVISDWVPELIKPLPDVVLEENSTLYNAFDLDDYIMDPDGDSLFYCIGCTQINIIINDDHTVDFSAPENWFGKEYVTFRAEDPTGAMVEDTITVTVIPMNGDNLTISSITLSKYGPSAGEEVTIYIEILNTGSSDCNVLARFFDGHPNDGGTQIDTNLTIVIPADGTGTVSVIWTATAGNHTLYVIVEDLATGEKAMAHLSVTVGENILPVLVLSTGDINIYRFEPGQERTISVEVTCYLQTVNNVHLVVLDDQNLTIDSTITPPRTMTDGDTIKFYLRVKAPELPEGVDKLEKDVVIQVVGDNGVFSNAEELDIVISKSAVSFLSPTIIAGAVATGTLASIGAAAAASRRNENWKYLLLSLFAVPLYTRIHGKKTLDNFVRGQVYGHIQSKPGTHFNEIRKTLKLGNGNLAYHLRKLEKEEFIVSKRDKRYRRFYPVGVEVPEEDGIMLSKTQENILDFIERHPKSGQKEIAEDLKESQQTISYNINVLVREGFLREEKIKGTKRYEILDENT